MIDAMKKGLEALQGSGYYDTTQQREAITALRQAIAEAEKPVEYDGPALYKAKAEREQADNQEPVA